MADRDLLSLPFDLYQRYRLVADVLREYPRSNRPLRVLDVGGRTAVLREFLPEASITLVDVEESDAAGLVLGSGCELPFTDGAFDVVTACDTLEHVPPARRDAFVREACRVSHGWVVLAGPYRSERVVEAEELLRLFLREKLGVAHRYLDEHGEHGLPDLAATIAGMEGVGARAVAIGHASLQRWLPLMCLSMYLDEDPQLRKVARRYYRFYNETLYASDHAGPVYRHVVVGSVNGVALPGREGLLDPPIAPPGALAAFDQLAGELVAFDREKEVYQAERARLTEVNDGLVADLAGHDAMIAELQEQLRLDTEGYRRAIAELSGQKDEQGEVIETLERDLAAHRESLEELREERRVDAEGYERTTAELSGQLEQQGEVIETLEQDLAAHRESLEELRAVRERMIADHEEIVAELQEQVDHLHEVLGELDEELGAHRDLVATQQDELAERIGQQAFLEEEVRRLNALASDLNDQLVAEHQENDRLRAELRNRFRNLKRALGPKKPFGDDLGSQAG